MFNTFHADYWFLRWPLDHLFHSQHFTVSKIQRLPSIGSDHYALYTKLAFTPNEGTYGNSIKGDADGTQWADEIVNEQDVATEDVPKPG
jgi:hypothetical protein